MQPNEATDSTSKSSRFWVSCRILMWAWGVTVTPDIYRMMSASYPDTMLGPDGQPSQWAYALIIFLAVTAAAGLVRQASRAVHAWTGSWLSLGLDADRLVMLHRYVTPLWYAAGAIVLYYGVDAPSCLTDPYSSHGTCNSEVLALCALGWCVVEGPKRHL